MSYRNKNTPCINKCAQIYKVTKIFIYFYPSWYDIHMHLNYLNTIIINGSKYTTPTFNINTRKTIDIVCVYKIVKGKKLSYVG